MTLVVSQSGAFTGGGDPSATVTPTPGTSPKAIIVGFASGGSPVISYGGVPLLGNYYAYGGISSTDVEVAYLLDISGRASDTLLANDDNNGNGSVVFWALIEGIDPKLRAGGALRHTGSDYASPSYAPTVAGGNVLGLLSRCNYSPSISNGADMTQLYAGSPKRQAYGGYKVGGIDASIDVSCVHGAPTGGWGASAYVFLEEQGVIVPKPGQAIIIAT